MYRWSEAAIQHTGQQVVAVPTSTRGETLQQRPWVSLFFKASQACTVLLPCCLAGSVEGRSLQALALAASFRLAPAPWDVRRSTAVYRGSCYSTANSSDASPKVQAWAARAQLARYGLPRRWYTVQGWSGVGHGRQDPAGMLLLCIDWGRRSYCPCGALRSETVAYLLSCVLVLAQ